MAKPNSWFAKLSGRENQANLKVSIYNYPKFNFNSFFSQLISRHRVWSLVINLLHLPSNIEKPCLYQNSFLPILNRRIIIPVSFHRSSRNCGTQTKIWVKYLITNVWIRFRGWNSLRLLNTFFREQKKFIFQMCSEKIS